ncbi:unnamed protein product [Pleuronectes platessa]|uniref:Uncharacterized protein n=1 Tax=Pleuronectes platessa TaxID=8262 RepID=A0A9N7UCH1_PLEPL|nr:unnamed protein product [Pleuronectes platessa]
MRRLSSSFLFLSPSPVVNRRLLSLTGPSQYPAVIRSRACCDDFVPCHRSLQAASATPPTKLVAGWRVLKAAISVLTNKPNSKNGGKKSNYEGASMLHIVPSEARVLCLRAGAPRPPAAPPQRSHR